MILIVTASASPVHAQAGGDEGGFLRGGNYEKLSDFEYFDSQSGQVLFKFTDLVLPGNRGRDLRIGHSLSGSGFYIDGVPIAVEQPAYIGWTTFILDAVLLTGAPRLYMGDGGVRQTYFEQFPPEAASQNPAGYRYSLSTSRWRYDRQERRLQMPDGTVCEYDAPAGAERWRLTSCSDPYGQFLAVSYDGNETHVRQILEGADPQNPDQEREVVFMTSCSLVCTMTYEGRVWTLTLGTEGIRFHSPGVAEEWRFEFSSAAPAPTRITTPGGGIIEYQYQEYPWNTEEPVSPENSRGWFPVSRTSSGSGITGGEWSFTVSFTVPTIQPQRIVSVSMTDPSGMWHRVTNCVDQGILNNGYYVIGSAVVPCLTEHGNLRSTATTYSPVELVTYTLPSSLTRTFVIPAAHVTTSTICDYLAQTTCATSEVERDYEGVFLNVTRVTERTSSLPGVERVTTTAYFDNIGSSGPYLMGLPEQITVSVGSDSVVTTNEYDENTGFLLESTAAGVTTAFTPGGRGNVASMTEAFGTAQASTSNFTYDWGVLASETSAVGTTAAQTTTRVINEDGSVASETAGAGSTNERVTSFTYDNHGRLTQVTPPGGSQPTVTAYDDTAGLWVRTTRGTAQVQTEFDGFGRPILTRSGTTSGFISKVRTSFYADGRVEKAGLPIANASTDNPGTTFVYQDLPGLVTQTRQDGSVTSQRLGVHADGNARMLKTTTIDEAGRTTVAIQKGFGGPLGRLVDAAGQTWTYTYDHITGALTQVAGPNDVTRSWVYASGTKRLQSETHPESGQVEYQQYWADGLLRKREDAKGTVFEYEYDAAGRPTEVTTTAGASVETTTIEYEPGSDLPMEYSTPDVVTTLDYDTAGRLISRTDTVDTKVFATTFTYDAQDNLTQITYPSGRIVKYAYDAANRLVAVCRASAAPCDASTPLPDTYARGFTYHVSGALTGYQTRNGMQAGFTYDDSRLRLSRLTGGANGEFDLTYTYDAVGNVTSIVDGTRPEWTQTFTGGYDALDRLTGAYAPAYGQLTYTYDAHGNRQTANGMTYQYATTNRFRLERIGGAGPIFSYDPNGNLEGATSGAFVYTYTPDNQMRTATVGSTVTQYAYDASQWRIKKAITGQPVVYAVRGPNGELLSEWTNSSPAATVRDYIYAGGRLLGIMTTKEAAK